jgi:hypothetical protein
MAAHSRFSGVFLCRPMRWGDAAELFEPYAYLCPSPPLRTEMLSQGLLRAPEGE